MADRDELLRQIGEKVVERVDEEGFLPSGKPTLEDPCPACDGDPGEWHTPDCPIAEYLSDD